MNRRGFFGWLGIGAGAAVAAKVLPAEAKVPPAPLPVVPPPDPYPVGAMMFVSTGVPALYLTASGTWSPLK